MAWWHVAILGGVVLPVLRVAGLHPAMRTGRLAVRMACTGGANYQLPVGMAVLPARAVGIRIGAAPTFKETARVGSSIDGIRQILRSPNQSVV